MTILTTRIIQIRIMPFKSIGQTDSEWKWERDSEQTETDLRSETLGFSPSCCSQLVCLAEKHQVEQTLRASGSVPKIKKLTEPRVCLWCLRGWDRVLYCHKIINATNSIIPNTSFKLYFNKDGTLRFFSRCYFSNGYSPVCFVHFSEVL